MQLPDSAIRRALPDEAATAALARAVADRLLPSDAVLLEGPLGAGKTAFARAMLRHLTHNPELEVPSPSYTLLQSYETRLGPVYHYDLWRLTGPADLAELGWEEARTGIVLVEWPDRLGVLRPPEALTVSLAHAGENARTAVLCGWPGRLDLL